jgi:hypothetical protein
MQSIRIGNINTKQIYYQSGYSDERGVKRILNGLVRLELLKRTGKSQSDPSAYYELNKTYKRRESGRMTTQPTQLSFDIK